VLDINCDKLIAMQHTFKLSNGVEMPVLGFGVFQIPPEDTARCVKDALSVGYRMIDTAQIYGNEEGVGQGIIDSGVPRKDIFIVTKIWLSNYGYEAAKASIEESLRKLKTDYIDLLLLHQPYCDVYGAYRAMEEAYRAGKLRAIGVSNFYTARLMDMVRNSEIPPMVNQMETHVYHQRVEERKYMEEAKVIPMAWSPFAQGRNGFFENETLVKIAKKHNKTVSQVTLRYLIDLGIIVIPKTTHKERMAENFNIFDFQLDDEDRAEIAKLNTNQGVILKGHETAESAKLILDLYDMLKKKAAEAAAAEKK